MTDIDLATGAMTSTPRAPASPRGQAMVEFALVAPMFFLCSSGSSRPGGSSSTTRPSTTRRARARATRSSTAPTRSAARPAHRHPAARPATPPVTNVVARRVSGRGVRRPESDHRSTRPWHPRQRPRVHGDRVGHLHLPSPGPARAPTTHHDQCGVEPCHQQLAGPGNAARSSCSSPAGSSRCC